jgi:hypothetical protein
MALMARANLVPPECPPRGRRRPGRTRWKPRLPRGSARHSRDTPAPRRRARAIDRRRDRPASHRRRPVCSSASKQQVDTAPAYRLILHEVARDLGEDGHAHLGDRPRHGPTAGPRRRCPDAARTRPQRLYRRTARYRCRRLRHRTAPRGMLRPHARPERPHDAAGGVPSGKLGREPLRRQPAMGMTQHLVRANRCRRSDGRRTKQASEAQRRRCRSDGNRS